MILEEGGPPTSIGQANSFETLETMTLVQTLNSAISAPQLLLPKTTDEHLVEVKNALIDLKRTVVKEGEAARDADKQRRIEFAIKNTDLVSKDFFFMQATTNKETGYKTYNYDAKPVNADEFLLDILLSFRKGKGHLLSLYFIDLENSGEAKFKSIKKEWVEAFRNKLCDKLDRLLGSHPRFQFRSDGRVILYYS